MAKAQSSTCVRLQNQLHSISSGGNRSSKPSARYRQYDRAVKNQRTQITKTQRMARRNGCGSNFFVNRGASTCGRILSSLDQMNANLVGLERERRRLAPRRSQSGERERRTIIRTMNQRGCFNNTPGQQFATARPRNRSLVEQIFGVRTFSNDGRRRDFERPNGAFSSRYNTYRTMCVRKIDGYYFPVSFSTTPDRFEYDERVCQSKCPNTEVALYYHAMPAQDSEDMVAFRGQTPYADLPAAFAYRKKFNPEASCRYSSGVFQEIAGSNGERKRLLNQKNATLARIGTPIYRVDRALDPETVANEHGAFDDAQLARLFAKPDIPVETPVAALNGRNIRVVGPAFYPVQ